MALRHKIQFMCGLVFLILGSLIYIAYRKDTLIMFRWFNYVGFDFKLIRKSINYSIPNFIKYSMPDGLWLLAYQLIVGSIWENILSKVSMFCIYSMPVVILIEEILQKFGLIDGTFDYKDILCYIVSVILSIIIILKVK